jgi:uncharacterized protein YbjT (DUF2867 family)
MPVLVTRAETAAGRAAAAALRRTGGEVRVWVDERAPAATVDACRGAGYKTAVGSLDDEGRLELALEQVHTVVHLAGDLLCEPDALLDDVASVLSAAIGAGCRRVIATSALAAGEAGPNPWLAACADAEQLLADAPLETVVFRTALSYGPDDALTRALAAPPPAQVRDVRHAPLFLDDLATAVAAADRERHDAADLHVVVSLVGPEVVSLGELSTRLAGVVAPAPAALPPYALEVLTRDGTGPPDALGRSGTSLAAALPRLAS